MRKFLITLFSLLLICTTTFAQTNETTVYDKYEYLVITFGKTYFNTQSSDSKYYMLFPSGQVGSTLNENLNILGNLGWELVDIVGVISGDQQLLLKRKIGLISEEKEDELIKQLAEERLEKRLQSLEASIAKDEEKQSENPLIETDNRDWSIEYETKNKKFTDEAARLADVLKTYTGVTEAIYNNNLYNSKIDIKCDFSDSLLKGNEYSLSDIKNEVYNLYSKCKYEVDFSTFVYTMHTIELDFTVFLTYEGTSYQVYTEEITLQQSYK